MREIWCHLTKPIVSFKDKLYEVLSGNFQIKGSQVEILFCGIMIGFILSLINSFYGLPFLRSTPEISSIEIMVWIFILSLGISCQLLAFRYSIYFFRAAALLIYFFWFSWISLTTFSFFGFLALKGYIYVFFATLNAALLLYSKKEYLGHAKES